MAPRRIALVSGLAVALVLLAGCKRARASWVADLHSRDPWRREMAALALRSVDDGEVELAVRLLLQKVSDSDPRVVQAVSGSLEVLAPRAVEPLIKALAILPPERYQHRQLLVRLLAERARAGDERARSALVEHLRAEVESRDAARSEPARALLDELGSG